MVEVRLPAGTTAAAVFRVVRTDIRYVHITWRDETFFHAYGVFAFTYADVRTQSCVFVVLGCTKV